jgi:hypothetical protein
MRVNVTGEYQPVGIGRWLYHAIAGKSTSKRLEMQAGCYLKTQSCTLGSYANRSIVAVKMRAATSRTSLTDIAGKNGVLLSVQVTSNSTVRRSSIGTSKLVSATSTIS